MGLAEKIGHGLAHADRTLMKGVNASVQAYNWTTGGTKAQLANNLQTLGAITLSFGAGINLGVLKGVFFATAALPSAHITQSYNVDIERDEDNAISKGLKDSSVEISKNMRAFGGYLFMAIPLISSSSYFDSDVSSFEKIGRSVIDLAFVSWGLSHHVMRADYLPPRKNCVFRGVDALKKAYKKYEEQNSLEPALLNSRMF